MKSPKDNKTPPRILTEAGLSMFVNTLKFRELPLPIVQINLEKLLWHFVMPVWEKDGTDDWNLTPQEVINKEVKTSTHQDKVQAADTSYPIIVTEYNSRLVILDGVHRLTKVFMNGEKTINAKIIPSEYLSRKEFQT